MMDQKLANELNLYLCLVYVNLINYMDRSTVAGMLDEIKRDKDFAIKKDKYLGLLQEIMKIHHLSVIIFFFYERSAA